MRNKEYQMGIDWGKEDRSGYYDWSRAMWIETLKGRVWIKRPKFIPFSKIKNQWLKFKNGGKIKIGKINKKDQLIAFDKKGKNIIIY